MIDLSGQIESVEYRDLNRFHRVVSGDTPGLDFDSPEKKMIFYNDNDQKAAAWLKTLVADELIPKGAVDDRNIEDLSPSEIVGFVQCHFFAGIGGWSYALRLAGWPEDRPVWTGSCPCQPFSCAGKGSGFADERHLWPAFRWLIAQCRPATIFGEQVASKDGRQWPSGVRADLEAMGYAVGAADLCAASVSAPHIRQRLFWVAHRNSLRCKQRRKDVTFCTQSAYRIGKNRKKNCRLADFNSHRCNQNWSGFASARDDGLVRNGADIASFWKRYETVCDEKGNVRRIEPGTMPLVDGFPGGVELIRGYGNAIVPQIAAEFIRAYAGDSGTYEDGGGA